jgi:hypothetical protein
MKNVALIAAFAFLALIAPIIHGQTTNTQANGCGLINVGVQYMISTQASWYCPINQQISSTWTPWVGVGILAILISFTVAAIIFMVGIALKSDKIRNFGIGEIYEATATAIIVIAFMYITSVLFGLWPSVLVGPINPYATAFHLMGQTINTTQTFYTALFNFYVSASFIDSITITPSIVATTVGGKVIPIPGWLLSILNPIMASASAVTNLIKAAASFMLEVLILAPTNSLLAQINGTLQLLYLEYYTMVFFSIAAVPVFLVPGVILRAFIPTRAMGGMMIAIAIGFYLVMPTMFSVVYYFTAPQLMQQFTTMTSTINQVNNQPMSQLLLMGKNSPSITTIQNAGTAMSSFWLLVLFYPMIIAGVTFAFIVQIGNFIGGSTQISSRIRTFI